MARRCAVCGKEPRTGFTVSHSHHKSKRRFAPNLQRVRAMVRGAPRRITVCAACLKSGRVTRVAWKGRQGYMTGGVSPRSPAIKVSTSGRDST